jgi:hypothetical protein
VVRVSEETGFADVAVVGSVRPFGFAFDAIADSAEKVVFWQNVFWVLGFHVGWQRGN